MTCQAPKRCVVDTNVATTANRKNEGAPESCVAASAEMLQQVMRSSLVYVDCGGEIVEEYRKNLCAGGAPGPGDAFFKWLLRHEWLPHRCTRVKITPKQMDPSDYEELPPPTGGLEKYDPSDRKFLAVAAAATPHPVVLQSFDCKWWGWQESLEAIGVHIQFLCPEAIEQKYREKMGAR
jgi:hypothetical protein